MARIRAANAATLAELSRELPGEPPGEPEIPPGPSKRTREVPSEVSGTPIWRTPMAEEIYRAAPVATPEQPPPRAAARPPAPGRPLRPTPPNAFAGVAFGAENNIGLDDINMEVVVQAFLDDCVHAVMEGSQAGKNASAIVASRLPAATTCSMQCDLDEMACAGTGADQSSRQSAAANTDTVTI